MTRFIKLHLLGIRIAFSQRMAYRADFFMSSIIGLAGDLVVPMITVLIYGSGASLPGWSVHEVLLVQGLFMFTKGIADTLFTGCVWNTLAAVREGTFDLMLLRPHSSLHLTMITAINCRSLGVVGGGAAIVGIALAHLGVPAPARLAAALLFLIFSVLVLLSFAIIMAATVFKWVGNSRVYEIADSLTLFGQYPATIYSQVIASVVTWVIPVAMIGFVPASVLLGKPVDGMVPAAISSIVLFAASLLFWHRMRARYESAGG